MKVSAKIIPLPSAARSPKISVVMVTYKTGPALLEAVNAVLQDPDIFELILVDNGNTPAARHSLTQLVMPHEKVRLLQGHGNIGFGKACNYGAKFATGNYILFLNPDAILTPHAAMKLALCGRHLKHPWVVGGLLRDVNGREQRGGRRRALTPLSAFVTFTGLHKFPFFKPIHMEREAIPGKPVAVPVVSGAFFMVDRESFDMLGGFDEKYFLHVEDIDLCRRARKKRGEVFFVPNAAVMHYGSTSRVPRQRVEWEKLKGFVKYFWGYSERWWAKILCIFAVPFMTLAIMGRAWWLVVRASLIGR